MNKTLLLTVAWICSAALMPSVAEAQGDAESRLTTRDSTFGLNLPGYGPQATQLRTYIVQLRDPGAAEIHAVTFGSRAGGAGQALRATVPFDRNSASVQNYTRRLAAAQDRVMARVAPGMEKIHSYQYSLNGFAARMTAIQAAKMESMPEVQAVWEDEVRPLTTNTSPAFLDLFD
ncbi:MAG: protease inhibitor I9 family protein, partial [Pseudomonadota bacterium]